MKLNALYEGRHYPPYTPRGIKAHRHKKCVVAELEIK